MFRKSLLLSVATVALGAAAAPTQASIFDRDVVTIKDLTPQGDDFSAHLARHYKEFSLFESGQMYDWVDADHFAEKAFAAVEGMNPQPEEIADWDIDGERHVADLKAARADLVQAFSAGAADIAPHQAAVAQAKFDCWVEQQEEGWQLDHIAACKRDFELAMDNLTAAMTPKETRPVAVLVPAPKQEVVKPKKIAVPIDQTWTVFFDFDKASLDDSAESMLRQLTALLQDDRDIQLKVTGHADRAGPADYNKILSERRADTVRDELTKLGLPLMDVEEVTVAAKGESAPAVQTADGVAEPRNRRVVIEAFSVEEVAMGDERPTDG